MRHAPVASLLGLAVAGLLTGCPDRSISEVNPLQGRVEAKDIPVKINRKVDILFLIDNSPSMRDKQQNLADNFPKFIDVLDSIQGGRPEVHIAVVTSDMGAKGALDTVPGPPVGQVNNGRCADVGDAGIMKTSGAPITNGAVFISDVLAPDGVTRIQNYNGGSGALKDVFATMAKVGDKGCPFEQHLEAMKQALQPVTAANRGFLRDDAFLAIIFIVDEDDCSYQHSSLITPDESGPLGPLLSMRCFRFGITCDEGGRTSDEMNEVGPKSRCHPNENGPLTGIDDYVKFLKNLKPDDPSKVIVAGIMGPTEPVATEERPRRDSTRLERQLAHSCTYVGGDGMPEVADPAIRLRFFLDQFPNRSTFAPICQRDLSGGLQQIGELLKTVIGDPCIEGKLADADPDTAGPQYDCAVSRVSRRGTASEAVEVLPHCEPDSAAATNTPCWRIATDNQLCAARDHLVLRIEGQDPNSLPDDTHIVANCVTEVENN
jgi:hypothetical protein